MPWKRTVRWATPSRGTISNLFLKPDSGIAKRDGVDILGNPYILNSLGDDQVDIHPATIEQLAPVTGDPVAIFGSFLPSSPEDYRYEARFSYDE